MKVKFGKKSIKKQGQLIPRGLTKHKPSIKFSGKAPYYTLVMVNSDAPMLHWMIINLRAMGVGHTVMPYKGPTRDPPHRYYVNLFSHCQPIRVETFRRRSNFSLDKFVRRQGLVDEGRLMFKTN